MVVNILRKIASPFLLKRAFGRLEKKIGQWNKVDWGAQTAIDTLFSDDAQLICPWQFKEELISLAQEIEKIHPQNVLEIGTANGGTLFLASRLSNPGATIISLDLPGGKYGGGYPEWKTTIYKSFERENQRIHLIRGNSHDPGSLNRIRKVLNGKELDYLFIDGDHTYEGVKKDFEIYSPLVRKGGLVAFHDIVKHPNPEIGVDKFWHEVKTKHKSKEFVNDWNQGHFGIGVIWMS